MSVGENEDVGSGREGEGAVCRCMAGEDEEAEVNGLQTEGLTRPKSTETGSAQSADITQSLMKVVATNRIMSIKARLLGHLSQNNE